MAQKRLLHELTSLRKEKWVHLEVDEQNLFSWKIGLMVVNPESVFNGAYLCAEMRFSRDYPYAPPSFRFTTRGIYHPNIYPDGRLCISILHTPGEDEQSGEAASERWSPLQGVESVLRSVLLLLDEPEVNSPANVDAGVLYRTDREKYKERARATAQQSRTRKPDDVHFPSQEELEPVPQKAQDDDDFWNESDPDEYNESDFDYDDEGDEEDSG